MPGPAKLSRLLPWARKLIIAKGRRPVRGVRRPPSTGRNSPYRKSLGNLIWLIFPCILGCHWKASKTKTHKSWPCFTCIENIHNKSLWLLALYRSSLFSRMISYVSQDEYRSSSDGYFLDAHLTAKQVSSLRITPNLAYRGSTPECYQAIDLRLDTALSLIIHELLP
jgi:hypothetical protein